jgi:hypothetical protein
VQLHPQLLRNPLPSQSAAAQTSDAEDAAMPPPSSESSERWPRESDNNDASPNARILGRFARARTSFPVIQLQLHPQLLRNPLPSQSAAAQTSDAEDAAMPPPSPISSYVRVCVGEKREQRTLAERK